MIFVTMKISSTHFLGYTVGSGTMSTWDENGVGKDIFSMDIHSSFHTLKPEFFTDYSSPKDAYDALPDDKFVFIKDIDGAFMIVKKGDVNGNGGMCANIATNFLDKANWAKFVDHEIVFSSGYTTCIESIGFDYPDTRFLPDWVTNPQVLSVKPYNGEFHIYLGDVRLSAHGYETEFGAEYALEKGTFVEIDEDDLEIIL